MDGKSSSESIQLAERRKQLKSDIMDVKFKIFQNKQILKDNVVSGAKKLIKNKKKDNKSDLVQYKEIVSEFIKNPNKKLLDKIDNKFELLEELSVSLQGKFEKALIRFNK